MTAPGNHIGRQFRLGLLTLAPIVAVMALLVLLPPDGHERAEWMQFVGRFHPLAVHFPIALILLVPILEWAGRSDRFSYLRLSSAFVLGLAMLGATAAAFLGWCLGYSGGYSGSLVTQHMWGGILVAVVCWACWMLRTGPIENGVIFRIALGTAIVLVAWTGYRGGQLALGADHLTEHMPSGLRYALGISNSSTASSSSVDATTFYGARVQPIFTARCVSCHGPDKQKGSLRLDSYRAVRRGGKDGPVVQAGNIQNSDLLRRITLPAGHDDFMPKGKGALSSDQVKVIELWIGAGASDTLAADAIQNAPTVPTASTVIPEATFEEIDPAAVARARSGIAPEVAQLQKQFPNILDYESRSSADLRLNASILGTKFGDAELAAFAPLAEHVTVADFSRTAITDRSATVITSMKRLRVLRLMHSAVTDATLVRLDKLDQLESLNVFGTSVTPGVLPTVSKLPKLTHFYAGETSIPQGVSVPPELTGKVVF